MSICVCMCLLCDNGTWKIYVMCHIGTSQKCPFTVTFKNQKCILITGLQVHFILFFFWTKNVIIRHQMTQNCHCYEEKKKMQYLFMWEFPFYSRISSGWILRIFLFVLQKYFFGTNKNADPAHSTVLCISDGRIYKNC